MDLSVKEWPSLKDLGRLVEVRGQDGTWIQGALSAVTLSSLPPVFVIHDADGKRHRISDPVSWSYI